MFISKYKFSVTYVTGLICTILGLFIVFFSSMQFNPIQNKYEKKRETFILVPQGWAFFTRSPREAQTIIYKVEGKGLVLLDHKHSDFANWMGLSRRASVIMSEMQIVKSKLHDSVFVDTKWNYQTCKIGLYPSDGIEVENEVNDPILCGDFVLVFQKPIPWAWSKSLKDIEMPATAVKVTVRCP
jgi:antimicrobial peptide system SdpA family protein